MSNIVSIKSSQQKAIKALGNAGKQSGTISVVVDGYCNLVQQQPTFQFTEAIQKKLPPVNTYLATAKTHCQNFQSKTQPDVLKLYSDLTSYGTRVKVFFPKVRQYLAEWENGNSDSKDKALKYISRVQGYASKYQTEAQSTYDKLIGFQHEVNSDAANFHTVYEKAKAVLGGDQGMIKRMEKQIGEYDKQIKILTATTVGSGLLAIGGGLLIGIGAVTSIFGGAGLPLIAGGVACLAAGAAGLTVSALKLSKAIADRSKEYADLTLVKNEYKILNQVKDSMASLFAQATQAATEVGTIAKSWTMLSSDLEVVGESLKDASADDNDVDDVRDLLELAEEDWKEVTADMKAIKSKIRTAKVKTIKDKKGNLGPMTESNLKALAA